MARPSRETSRTRRAQGGDAPCAASPRVSDRVSDQTGRASGQASIRVPWAPCGFSLRADGGFILASLGRAVAPWCGRSA